MPKQWFVKKTACWPCSWKVVHKQELDGITSDNAAENYFESFHEAIDEADRREVVTK